MVLYGHDSWTIPAEDANALGVFERRILQRWSFGAFEHGAWRRRINHELVELYGEPDILPVTKAGACHEDAARMPHPEGVLKRS